MAWRTQRGSTGVGRLVTPQPGPGFACSLKGRSERFEGRLQSALSPPPRIKTRKFTTASIAMKAIPPKTAVTSQRPNASCKRTNPARTTTPQASKVDHVLAESDLFAC